MGPITTIVLWHYRRAVVSMVWFAIIFFLGSLLYLSFIEPPEEWSKPHNIPTFTKKGTR